MKAVPAPMFRQLFDRVPCPATDAALLDRFVNHRDETAFSALVARHGPMVLRVCRRVLGNVPDAEDAFQATFLVLARKAGAIRRRNHLAAWLHGTACRVALKARTANARRRRGEVPAPVPDPPASQPDPLTQMTARELLTALDEEIGRLPEAYRLPLILCCLEGRTQDEAARLLGWSPGSVRGRLERGRARLHDRLARRGLSLSAGLLAIDALHGPAVAGVPAALLHSAAQSALRFAAGVRSVGEGVSRSITLAEGALKAMLLTKMKIAATIIMILACAGMGLGGFAFRSPAAGEGVKSSGAPPEKKEAPNGLTLTLSADKTETLMQPDGKNAVPVNLKLSFTNNTDKPVKLDAYALPYRIKFHCDGPAPDSIHRVVVLLDQIILPPTEADYPAIQPGKSWSPSWTPSFPGDMPEGYGAGAVYYLRQPGIYKLRMTVYDKYAPHTEGAAPGTKLFESNELKLKVFEKKPPGMAPVPKAQEAARTDLDNLQGVWTMASREYFGVEKIPDDLARKKNYKLTIKGDEWTWAIGTNPAPAGPGGCRSATIALDPSKTPKLLDITAKVDGKESFRRGIYKLEGDTLTYCLERVNVILKEDGTPRRLDRPAKFAVTEDSTELIVWKRSSPATAPATGKAASDRPR